MNLKYIKKFIFATVVLSVFLFSFTLNTKAATTTIKYLTASVGESYDKMGISYHCSTEGSYVIYGTSLSGNEISSPITVNPTETLWGLAQHNGDSKSGMADRYVCKANLTNLSSNTKYYYQAVCGSVKSTIQSFTTAPNNSSNKTFYFLTDIQSSGTGFEKAETLLKAMESKTSPASLIVMTGDQVDRGGYEVQWEDYHKYVPSLQHYAQATIPGNHEYYFSNSSDYISNEIYNQFYNNPLNGPTDRLGSSYYFVWDQILFIMLDTIKSGYSVKQHQEWFKNVVKNNPAQWIIVGAHPGCYATGAYESDTKIMRSNWLEVFQDCQVDLYLNGHEHVYARVNTSYNGQTDELKGVTYLAGGAAGMKDYSTNIKTDLLEQFTYYSKSTPNTGVAISIDNGELTCTRYNAYGTVLDEFTLYAKRPKTVTPMTEQEILDSFQVTHDAETSKATLSWSKDLYGNVESFKVESSKLRIPFEYIVTTNNVSSQTWNGYYTDYNFHFKITITMKDGSTLIKELDLILNIGILDYNITYELDGGINHPDNPSTFNGKDLPIDLTTYLKAPTKEGYDFVGWKLNGGRKPTDTVEEETYEDITLTAVWEESVYNINYNLNGGENSILNPITYKKSSLPVNLYAPTKEHYEFIGWYLNGETVQNLPDSVNSDITLDALWKEKEYTISYNLNGGSFEGEAASTHTITNKPTLPTPIKKGYNFTGWKLSGEIIDSIPSTENRNITLSATWEKAKGCKKSAVYELILGISLLSTSLILFRKKH